MWIVVNVLVGWGLTRVARAGQTNYVIAMGIIVGLLLWIRLILATVQNIQAGVERRLLVGKILNWEKEVSRIEDKSNIQDEDSIELLRDQQDHKSEEKDEEQPYALHFRHQIEEEKSPRTLNDSLEERERRARERDLNGRI